MSSVTPVSAPQLGPLEFLENEHVAVLSQQFVPEGLGCTWVQQTLVREERSPVLAQLDFQMCSGSSLKQRSVPDGFGCTQAHQTLPEEEMKQRPVAQKPLHATESSGFTKPVMSRLKPVRC